MNAFFRGLGMAGGLLLIFSLAEAKEIRYDKGERRDPFVPLVGSPMLSDRTRGEAGFRVEGIVFDANYGSYAVVGGEIYREGETVNGAKLIKILPNRIILQEAREEIVVWLREEILNDSP